MSETKALRSQAQLRDDLHAVGDIHYHDKHPFHLRMHEGSLSQDEVRCWIRNRFYYQTILPIKDTIVMAKLPSDEDRRLWLQRIVDQNGTQGSPGGIAAWLSLGLAAAVPQAQMISFDLVSRKVRDASDSYVDFCRERSWLEAVASSLTELFAPKLIAFRLEVFKKHYGWIDSNSLDYFFRRLKQAPRDSEHALRLVLENARTVEAQTKVIEALRFKCNVLWQILDGIEEQCRTAV